MLKLRAPSSTDKPKTRAENSAAAVKTVVSSSTDSTNMNTKKLPELQQRTMDGRVAGAKKNETGAAKNDSAPDTSSTVYDSKEATGPSKFVEFFEAYNAKSPHISSESLDALDYLKRGAPFHGESTFADKASVKAGGAHWTPNKFVDDENGSQEGIKRATGWWSARDEDTLIRLLKLRDRDRIVWTPRGLDVHAANCIRDVWAAHHAALQEDDELALRADLDALDYLKRGAPFRGESTFADKASVKAGGAHWTPNKFVDDENGPQDGMKHAAGWWSARDEDTLIHLLELRDKDRIIWTPLGLDVHAASALYAHTHSVLAAHQRTIDATVASETESRAAQLEARERAVHARERAVHAQDIPADDPEDVSRLVNELMVPWTEEDAAASSRSAGLGPHAGVARARRALRALHLRIVTIDAARRGDWEVEELPPLLELPESRRCDFFFNLEKAMNYRNRNSSDVHDEEKTGFSVRSVRQRIPSPLAHAKSTALTSKIAGGGRARSDDHHSGRRPERKVAISPDEESCAGNEALDCNRTEWIEYPSFKRSRTTWCTACGARIDLQFADCACRERRVWTECKECQCSGCDEQPCPCSAGDGWWARQYLAKREEGEELERAKGLIAR